MLTKIIRFILIVLGVLFLIGLIGSSGWALRGCTATPATTAATTIAPTTTPTPTVTPTATPTPTPTPTEAPLPTNPAILASLDGKTFSNQGEYLNTNLGERMTFTNRKIVVPNKEWNETLSKNELTKVEQTWVDIQLDVPEGMTAIIFAGGLEQGINRYENGILMTLTSGHYEFSIRNGEIVLWYPLQETYQANDIDRIVDQIRNGNFDIKSELEFFGVTADLLSSIPDDLVKERNIQIISDLVTTK
ncbi:MAG: hypothetical protein WCX33_00705 [Candidatus Shapirobacteria bacterium]